jgi:chlorite dismutase
MGEPETGGQYVHFGFYRVDMRWRRLPKHLKDKGKREFAAAVREHANRFFLQSYSLLGLRADADFMIWKASRRLEDFQAFASAVLSTGLGGYLETPYAFLSMTRRSQYVREHAHEGQEATRLRIEPGAHRYLCVYPFTKTDAWYQLPFETRQEMMNEHFVIGHKYPKVRLHTTYSFGLDDQEFVLAFETDELEDFLSLVMELRESAARPYTLRDTPIFTCVRTSVDDLLASLG